MNDQAISPLSVTKYIIFKCNFDGELISHLKMQKILYYIYSHILVQTNISIFNEKFQAWANGPVLPSIYQELKEYKSSPINDGHLAITEDEFQDLATSLPHIDIINSIYQNYIIKSAFELVSLTHNELPWKNARLGLNNTEPSSRELEDTDIFIEYGQKA